MFFTELSALHISPVDNAPSNVSKNYNVPQGTVFFDNRNHNYRHNTVYRQLYEQQQQQQQPFGNMILNGGIPPVWEIGDKCLAPWSDGQVRVLSYTVVVVILDARN